MGADKRICSRPGSFGPRRTPSARRTPRKSSKSSAATGSRSIPPTPFTASAGMPIRPRPSKRSTTSKGGAATSLSPSWSPTWRWPAWPRPILRLPWSAGGRLLAGPLDAGPAGAAGVSPRHARSRRDRGHARSGPALAAKPPGGGRLPADCDQRQSSGRGRDRRSGRGPADLRGPGRSFHRRRPDPRRRGLDDRRPDGGDAPASPPRRRALGRHPGLF